MANQSSWSKFDSLLDTTNKRLDKVRIRRRGKSLYLRATLPPKSGEPKAKQRDLPTGKSANKPGLEQAKALALDLESELIRQCFSWDKWDPRYRKNTFDTSKSSYDWGQEFGAQKSRQIQESTYIDDYAKPLSKLPRDKQLSGALLIVLIEQLTKDRTKSRVRYVSCYQQLADFAGIEVNLRTLNPAGGYKSKPIRADEVPTDEEILETWEKLRNPEWKAFYARIACYGMRPHEPFFATFSSDPDDPFAKIPDETKTGYHIAYPWPADWWSIMKPWEGELPPVEIVGKNNKILGSKAGRYFRETGKIGHTLYFIRHAYAIRTALSGAISDSIAAKWMGHSITIHSRTYHQAISESQHQQAWQTAKSSVTANSEGLLVAPQ
ncbi:hypothetical protein SPB21_07165 [Leptothoe sp. ISB3NOV94-8A]